MNTPHANPSTPPQPLPAFLTVEEAAAIVRIGRTTAYELAARYEATDGEEGLPVVRIGRQLRVPTARLEEWAGTRLSGLPQDPGPVEQGNEPVEPAVVEHPTQQRRGRRGRPSTDAADGGGQSTFPFSA
jgi:excisionase family DNA binding protein